MSYAVTLTAASLSRRTKMTTCVDRMYYRPLLKAVEGIFILQVYSLSFQIRLAQLFICSLKEGEGCMDARYLKLERRD